MSRGAALYVILHIMRQSRSHEYLAICGENKKISRSLNSAFQPARWCGWENPWCER